jgi:hypothetical protein
VIPIPLPVIAALAAAAIGAASGWTLRGWRAGAQIEALRADLATAKADHASAVSRAASAALAQSEAHRQTEAAWTRRMQEATDVLTKDRAALAARAAAAAGDAGRLRNQLNAYTCTASSGPASDTGAASGAGSASLGDVLDGVLRDYRAAVGAAEDHAADVRALLRAWPRGEVKP